MRNVGLRIAVVLAFMMVVVGVQYNFAAPEKKTAKVQPNGTPVAPTSKAPKSAKAQNIAPSKNGLAEVPMYFEKNQGQTDSRVQFLARGGGYTLFLTPDEAVFSLHPPHLTQSKLFRREKGVHGTPRPTQNPKPSILRMKLSGGNSGENFEGMNQLPGVVNYLIGRNPKNWHTGISTFASVHVSGVYPGIDMVYYGNQRQLEYDFVVKPGADATKIAFEFEGAGAVSLTQRGEVKIDSPAGKLTIRKPSIYQMQNGLRAPVEGDFVVREGGRVGVDVKSYDRTKPLVIDPVLAYSTYLGGTSEDFGNGIAVDNQGFAYIAGCTDSTDFPTVGTSISTPPSGQSIAFVSKLNQTGSGLVYSTYLGGTTFDAAYWIAVDGSGQAYATGLTSSPDFPVTSNAFQSIYGSGASFNAFLAKLSPDGRSLLYSTFLGGAADDEGWGIAVDTNQNAYLTGYASSENFPVTQNAFQSSLNSVNGNAFVARIDTTQTGASSLVYSTFLGGSSPYSIYDLSSGVFGGDGALSIAVDANHNAYVVGEASSTDFPITSSSAYQKTGNPRNSVFLTRLDTSKSGAGSLIYSTFLGGTGSNGDLGEGISLDPNTNAYITGCAFSPDFPVTIGSESAPIPWAGKPFVAEFNTNAAGAASLRYSTLVGGNGGDCGSSIAVDPDGDAYVGGLTSSSDFPVTTNALQSSLYSGSPGAGFVFTLSPDGSNLLYSTYFGGSGTTSGDYVSSVALDGSANLYFVGQTDSPDLPTTSAAFQTSFDGALNAFVAKLTGIVTTPLISGVLPNVGDVGTTVTITGGNFGATQGSSAITFNGTVATPASWSDTSITAVVPLGATSGSVLVTVNGSVSNPVNFVVAIPPTISASVFPSANAAGWYNSSVSVIFSCTPGTLPLANCTSPVTLSSEGANQVISGTAVDSVGGTATISVSANIDMTPPTVTISSPANGATVNSTALTVTGTAVDSLSGLSSVLCNGVAATITGSNFSCSLTISSAVNSIAVSGTDVAGNTSTTTISVNLVVAGSSESTGSLNVARENQTATLLTTGMVLIAGGSSGTTAELYDPSSGLFSFTGQMTALRSNHTATLLNDGTVLITGGFDANNIPLNSAEIYNPATGSFSSVANMSTGRASHTATLLNDGTVLIAGGNDSNFNALASAELYDPASGTFIGVGTLVAGRVSHTATLLNNGKVLFAGGQDTNYKALNAAELFDPGSRTFSSTGSLNTARDLHTATLLNSGMVLIVGGQDTNYNPQGGVELYDPNAGTFAATGSMVTARLLHTATLLNNGAVLIAGGTDDSFHFFSSVELYDPIAQTFSAAGSMNSSRSNHSGTLLSDGTVLLTGGQTVTDFSVLILSTAEIYEPSGFTPPGLVSISVGPATPTVSVGTVQRFTATGTFADNSTEVLSSATWSSSNNTVATVTNDRSNRGTAIGLSTGTSTVSACAGSICGSTILTVGASGLSITGLSPSNANIGAQVVVAGTGFDASQGSSIVNFNGTVAPVSLWSATGIVVTVPAGATTGNVIVTVGGANSNGALFTVSSSPVITSLTPTVGPAGTAVVISGTNFGANQGNSSATFNGLPATVTSWSDASIGVTVPNGATTGNLVVSVSGVPSNGIRFAVPVITEMVPTTGPVGTLVTISGSGFGATQGSGSVTINGTAMQVVSWSDSLIRSAVSSGTSTGAVAVYQGSLTISGPTFTVLPSPTPGAPYPLTSMKQAYGYVVSPETLSLLVGQTRNISVTDGHGNPVGVQWLTTNPGVVSLSNDNPPMLTGVAPGQATVYAGNFPVQVAVYSGPSLPVGTTAWSIGVNTVPGQTGQTPGQVSVVPAVPSSTGADAYVLDMSGTLSALAADGTLVWTAQNAGYTGGGYSVGGNLVQPSALATTIIPDFSGGVLLKSAALYGDPGSPPEYTHSVSRYDPITGQITSLYKFTDVLYDNPTSFLSDQGSVQAVIPDTTGILFIQDNGTVLVFNLATGQQIASVSTDPPSQQNEGAASNIGRMIVAGDGNAYLPYGYAVETDNFASLECVPTSLQVGTCIEQQSGEVRLLRVSPDGSYANIHLGSTWTFTTTCVEPNCTSNGSGYFPYELSAITNADGGVAVFASGYDISACSCLVGGDGELQITYVSNDAVVGQSSNVTSFSDGLANFKPVLQREDGSYIGVHVGSSNSTVYAITAQNSATQGVAWQQLYSMGTADPGAASPLYATSDGGILLTTTAGMCRPGDISFGDGGLTATCQTGDLTPWQSTYDQSGNQYPYGQLGTQYTLNQTGSTMLQSQDTGARISWTGSWYQALVPTMGAVTLPQIIINTLRGFFGGNPSQTDVASRPWYFILNWQNGFYFVPDDPHELSALQTDITSDATAIKSAALQALKQAYSQWPVTVVEGTVGTGDISNVVQNSATDGSGQATIDCGLWTGGSFYPYSTVGYDCVMKNAQWALSVTINNAQDEAAALQQQSLIQAIGRGTGNVSAHEIAHQFLSKCCGMDARTADDPNAAGTYNNGVKVGGTEPTSDLADYTGYGQNGNKIHWEDQTKQALAACLGKGYQKHNANCPVENH